MRDTSVYVHFPWCLQKCPYCDFASAAIDRARVPHATYADALLRELEQRAAALADRRLVSVFFGGGTPSLWEPRELGRVLRGVRAAFAAETADLEVTVECNPSSLDRARAAALCAQGVTRLSIGVQSLDDAQLRFLGRLHDAEGALRAVRDAAAEIPRVSGDVIFGMPGLAPEAACETASRVLDAGARHLSAYSLTLEPGTQFGELARKGRLAIAPDEEHARTFLALEAHLARAGLEHYEVSSYAAPGERARHNVHTWRGLPYLGLGAGAVGALDGPDPARARRFRNEPRPERYLEAVVGATTEVFEETLDAEVLVREALMLGLRTSDGVALDEVRARLGVDPLRGRERAVATRVARGDLVHEPERLRVPRARWLHLDAIVSDLF